MKEYMEHLQCGYFTFNRWFFKMSVLAACYWKGWSLDDGDNGDKHYAIIAIIKVLWEYLCVELFAAETATELYVEIWPLILYLWDLQERPPWHKTPSKQYSLLQTTVEWWDNALSWKRALLLREGRRVSTCELFNVFGRDQIAAVIIWLNSTNRLLEIWSALIDLLAALL